MRIGGDVTIGANAVVTRNVGDRAVVGGVPAGVIGNNGSSDFVCFRGMETDPARAASLAQAGKAESAAGGLIRLW